MTKWYPSKQVALADREVRPTARRRHPSSESDMLKTRLWMGSILAAFAAGMLLLDPYLAPVYPFLLIFHITLTCAGAVEMILLLGPNRRPQVATTLLGVFALGIANWLAHLAPSPWGVIVGVFIAMALAVFMWEMYRFREPGRSTEQMALTLLILVYLGLLPCCFAQLRWLEAGSTALALAIFVPKSCDIGAYFTGRLFGRHRMTPILSPKKTWEGAFGGLALASCVAIVIDHLGPAQLLHGSLNQEIAFGVVVGGLGMLGDLAESLLKRDCRHKDASTLIPGFGGVLDVIDALILSAPVTYLWLR